MALVGVHGRGVGVGAEIFVQGRLKGGDILFEVGVAGW